MNENLTIVLGALVAYLLLRDKLAPIISKLKIKLRLNKTQSLIEHHAAKIGGSIERLGSELMLHRGEYNHIKGQLQELMQREQDAKAREAGESVAAVKRHKDVLMAAAALQGILEQMNAKPVVDVSPAMDTLAAEMGGLKTALEKATGEEAAATNSLYMQSLGSLAKSQAAILEHLQKLESNQVQMVEAINRLTT